MEIAEKIGIKSEETTIATYDLYTADECFLTGTGAEIVPVVKIDGRMIGNGVPGKITKMVWDNFKKYVSS